jgi:hypothetical protein
LPKELKGLSDKVPQHVLDKPESLLELLTSAAVDDIGSTSITKLMNYYDKIVGTEAFQVGQLPIPPA